MKRQFLRLGKNTLIYGMGAMITRFIGFLLLPLFTAYLSPTDYGVLAILALIGSVAQPLVSLGLGAGIGPCYFEGNSEERKATSIWTAFMLLLISSIVLAAIAVAFSNELSWLAFQNAKYGRLVSLSIYGIALSNIATPFTLRLQFEEKAVLFVILTVASSLTTLTLSVLMVIYLRWGVEGMVLSQLLGQLANALLFMIPVARHMKFRLKKSVGRQLLSLGLPLVPSFAFIFILLQSNKYLLQWFGGLEEVGIYSIGFNFGAVMSLVVGAFTTAWYPYFMSFMEHRDKATVLFGRIFTYYIYGIGTLCLFFFIFAKPVVMIMTRPSFHNAYEVVGLSATAQFCTGLFSLLLPGVYFAREVKCVSIVQGFAAIVSVILNLILIPRLGAFGAALALAVGFLAMVALQQGWNTKRKHTYLQVTYEWGRVLKFSALFLLIATISLVKRKWPLWAEISTSLILTVATLSMLVGLLDSREKEQVRLVIATAKGHV